MTGKGEFLTSAGWERLSRIFTIHGHGIMALYAFVFLTRRSVDCLASVSITRKSSNRFSFLVLLLVFPWPASQYRSLLICWRITASDLEICDQTALRVSCLSARAELQPPPEVATVRQRLELPVFSPMSSRAPNKCAQVTPGCVPCEFLSQGPARRAQSVRIEGTNMRFLRHPLLILCLGVAACSPSSPVRGSTTTVTIQGQSYTLTAGSGCFWDEPVYNVSNTVAYVIRNRGDRGGWDAESIARVNKRGGIEPVVAACATPQGTIFKIYGVSEDGERLLVELHFLKRATGNSTEYGTRPVILDVNKGVISEVKF